MKALSKSLGKLLLAAALFFLYQSEAVAGFTVTSGHNDAGTGSNPISVTINVPAGDVVAAMAYLVLNSVVTAAPGTVTDSNSTTYTELNYSYDNGSNGVLIATFCSLNSGSTASSITYTPPVSQTYFSIRFMSWVLEPTTGTVTCPDSAVAVGTFPTTPNGVTTATLSTTSTDAIVLGGAYDLSNDAVLSAGTAPSMTVDWNFNSGIAIFGHSAVSTSSPVTWTTSTSGDAIATMGIMVQIASSGPSCSNDGYTEGGALTVPTASSTEVWLKSGAFGMVDCSSTEYWQPENGGVFGDN